MTSMSQVGAESVGGATTESPNTRVFSRATSAALSTLSRLARVSVGWRGGAGAESRVESTAGDCNTAGGDTGTGLSGRDRCTQEASGTAATITKSDLIGSEYPAKPGPG